MLQVVDQRPDGPAEVDRAVLVEAGVLDRDDGLPHRLRDLAVGDRHPVDPARVVVREQLAVPVQQLGADRKLV